MTTPQERTRAVIGLGQSVLDLGPYMHGKRETVRVPRELLLALRMWLRHYPSEGDLDITAQVLPGMWGPAPLKDKS